MIGRHDNRRWVDQFFFLDFAKSVKVGVKRAAEQT